jgi:hypothetical protein
VSTAAFVAAFVAAAEQQLEYLVLIGTCFANDDFRAVGYYWQPASTMLLCPALNSMASYGNRMFIVLPHAVCHADPKILLLNIELELKSEKENAEIRLDDPAKYQSIVDAGGQGC